MSHTKGKHVPLISEKIDKAIRDAHDAGDVIPTDPPPASFELRDKFAAAAMQGMFASGDWSDLQYDLIADAAYRTADAMIRERSKPRCN